MVMKNMYWNHHHEKHVTFTTTQTPHKKWGLASRISSVNVTKSPESCRSGHIYWRDPCSKTPFCVYTEDNFNPNAYLFNESVGVTILRVTWMAG